MNVNQRILEYGLEKEPGNPTWREIANRINREFGDILEDPLTGNAVRKRHDNLKDKVSDPFFSVGDLHDSNLDGGISKEKRLKDVPLDEVDEAWMESYLIEMGLNPNHYEFEPVKIWGDAHNPRASLRVVPKSPQGPDLDKMVDHIVEGLDYSPPLRTPDSNGDLMALFSLYDAHIGKISVDGGGMAADTYKDVLADLVGQVVADKGSQVQKSVLIIGQDWTNFDNTKGTTTLGTPQENFLTFNQLVEQQSSAMVWSIEYLLEHFGNAEVHFVPGNHDRESNFWLYQMAKRLYEDCVDVTICGGGKWSVVRWGEVGILSIHADEGKEPDYIKVWSTSDPVSFSFCRYKEIHIGHPHTRKKKVSRDMGDWYEHELESEDRGILTRYMPGLSVTDSWHDRKLYVNNHQLGQANTYSMKRPVSEHWSFIS